jgi:tetratricopeptide (TPR) repeat protein
MGRGLRVLGFVAVLLGSAALAAVLIWQEQVHGVAPVLGLVLLALGAAGMILHLSLSDDFLRRHLGDPTAGQTRGFCRSGWVGVLLGAALLGLHYLDHWVQETTARTNFQVAFNRGVSAAKARDWQAAADAFSEAIRVAPPGHADTARAYTWRGTARMHLKEDSQAIDDLSEALRLDPNGSIALYNRGVAYCRKEEYDRALSDFTEAIRLNPGYAKAYLARSSIYGKRGDSARARADRQRAAELDSSMEKSGGGNP